jgi:hypothetical protein
LSYSEISTALTCECRWDLAYGGHLAGGVCYSRRQLAASLSNGRAWGAAVAFWHAFSRPEGLMAVYWPTLALVEAHAVLGASLQADVDEQAQRGVWVPPEVQAEHEDWLGEILEHYCATTERLSNVTRLEDEIFVPIPSRGGWRHSSIYRFHGFIDAFSDQGEDEWVVEFKFRDQLTPPNLLELSRQIRWYAWARQQQTGRRVIGVVVDERLAAAPKPPRLVRAKRKGEGIDGMVPSHAKDQLCLGRDYIDLCNEYGVFPDPETVDALERRVWQQRHPILFRPGELEEAGRELVSAAQFIRDLDLGHRYPIRNGQPHICRGCRFKEICPVPTDRLFAETLFEPRPPKRERALEVAA